MATSGTTKRQGTNENGTWHHIIDPRTGQPANTDILTATVGSSTATEADIYAKCVVIRGSKEMNQCMDDYNLKALLLQTKQFNTIRSIVGLGSAKVTV